MEASVLWKEVKVYKEWDWGSRAGSKGDGEVNQTILKIFSIAENVTILHHFPNLDLEECMMSVAGEDMPNLRTLSLAGMTLGAATLSLFLSNCPVLESLQVDDELLDNDHIHISH